jgi:hypothetical protein
MTAPATLKNALQMTGIRSLGIGLPLLAPAWNAQGPEVSFTFDATNLTLSASTGNGIGPGTASWAAPVSGLVRTFADAARLPVTLLKLDGTAEQGPGVLITMYAQSYLRLSHLYAEVLEVVDPARPERAAGLPIRPVPIHFFFPGPLGDIKSGTVTAWERLERLGAMRHYDADGNILDPRATASCFTRLMLAHPLLQSLPIGATALTSIPLEGMFPGETNGTRLRLLGPDGLPFSNAATLLTGLTAVDQTTGMFSAAPGSTLNKAAVSGTFPVAKRERLLFGPATSGRLTDSFVVPPATGADGSALKFDYFVLRALELDTYLLGDRSAPSVDTETRGDEAPEVRLHEALQFHIGNEVLAEAGQILAGTPDVSLAVGQELLADFVLPSPAVLIWPQFKGLAGVVGAAGDPNRTPPRMLSLAPGSKAEFITGTPSVDVLLTLKGLPDDAWVRVYPRRFVDDAREERGDGAGGLSTGGDLVVRLVDPFSLIKSGSTVPNNPTLHLDLMVLLPNRKSRVYGNLSLIVGVAVPVAALPVGNSFNSATFRGICRASVLGLGKAIQVPALPTSFRALLNLLLGETPGQPRDAPRFPGMARRELLVAAHNATGWRAVLSAGRLAPESLSSDARLGNPGSRGGRETQLLGVSAGGRVAYDIAFAALRRCQAALTRLETVQGAAWAVPAEPTAVPVGQVGTGDSGTFAAAVLQNIAPKCETPPFVLDGSTSTASIAQAILDNNIIPAGFPFRSEIVSALTALASSNPPPADQAGTPAGRASKAVTREVRSVAHGRRDSLWSIEQAIKSARHSIYLETSGFAPTVDGSALNQPAYARDLIKLLREQLEARPGLRLILCIPRSPDFPESPSGYEPMIAYELKERWKALIGDGTAASTPLKAQQVVVFHPVGFPGRASRIEGTLMVVDDRWLLLGSSSFRRRGFGFDGSHDLVCTDTQLERGASKRLGNFRRGVMAERLGAPPNSSLWSELRDLHSAFAVVRQMLVAGGLGVIERLWSGDVPGQAMPPMPAPIDQANPDGRNFDLVTALAIAIIADLKI